MRFLLLPILLLCAACDSTSPLTLSGETVIDGVIFRVDHTQIRSGDTLELALINGSDRIVSTGSLGCATVERQRGDNWEVLPSDNQRGCFLPLFAYEPGQAHTESFLLNVAPGTVRLAHGFGREEGGDWVEIRTPSIRVTG